MGLYTKTLTNDIFHFCQVYFARWYLLNYTNWTLTIYSSTFELVENSWTKQLCRILPRNADFVSLIWWVCISFSCSCRNVTLICPGAKFWMIWKLGSEAMKCHFFFNIGLLHSQPHLSLWREVGSTFLVCVCVCVCYILFRHCIEVL